MRLKSFNKELERKKLILKSNRSSVIKKRTIILSVVIITIGIIYYTFARFESNKVYTLVDAKVGEYYNSKHISFDKSVTGVDCSDLSCALDKFAERIGN